MLGKLAYRNTKRNIKDYLIYLITVTASFSREYETFSVK